MGKDMFLKILTIVCTVGITFAIGMVIGGNGSDGMTIYIVTTVGIAILSLVSHYTE